MGEWPRRSGVGLHVRSRLALLLLGLAWVIPQPALAQDRATAQRATVDRATVDRATVDRARTLFEEGSTHYGAGRLTEAQSRFLEAWRLLPSPQLAYNVARTYERMGDAQRGIEFYRHYLSRADAGADDREDVERRIRDLEAISRRQREQIVLLPPSDDELTAEARRFFERGVVMFRRRRFEAAMVAFTAAYQFARLPDVIYNLAVTAERLERHQDAIDYYREYARNLERESPERRIIDAKVQALREQARAQR